MTLIDGWPPFYGERSLSASLDIRQLYLAFVGIALLFGLLLILPGVRGRERFYFTLRWSISLLVGVQIVACGQGLSWQDGSVNTGMKYRVLDDNISSFHLHLSIGLIQFNVSLYGDTADAGQSIAMNEKFYFLQTDEMFVDGLRRGIPFPILSVADHFTNTRSNAIWPWGRKYWIAGHYAAYLLWTAFACWLITIILFNMDLQYGSIGLMITGALLLLANVSFSTVNSGGRLGIRVGFDDPSKLLQLSYGWCFWVILFDGVVCMVLGIAVSIMLRKNHQYLEKFFWFGKEEQRKPVSYKQTDHELNENEHPDGSDEDSNKNPCFQLEVDEVEDKNLDGDVNENTDKRETPPSSPDAAKTEDETEPSSARRIYRQRRLTFSHPV